jgi:hypothetical protein
MGISPFLRKLDSTSPGQGFIERNLPDPYCDRFVELLVNTPI